MKIRINTQRYDNWNEDIRLYTYHGFWALPTKIMKMMWKVPQFVEAKFMK